jgi:methionine-rich copper-binding protein CopC
MTMRKLRLLLALSTLLLGGAGAALAHAFLSHALPAVGDSVKTAPAKLELWFSEAVEPSFSSVTLTDGAGQAVALGPLTADPGDKAHLEAALPSLAPGTYKVSWQVVSVDTHRTSGSFSFTVAP